MKNRFSGDRKYLYWGVTAFSVIAAGILLYVVADNWLSIHATLSKIMQVLSPFIWGAAITYLLRPLVNFFERYVTAPLGDVIFKNNQRRVFGFGRAVAIIISELIMILIVSALLRLVLPQLYSSIDSIISNSQTYYDNVVTWIEKVLNDYPQVEQTVMGILDDASAALIDWAKTSLLPQMTNILSSVTSGVIYFVRGLYYIAVGIIVSIYLLFNKEAVAAGGKRMLYSVFTVDAAKKLLDGLRFTDATFMDFLSGKLLDSAIIGVLCYICCTLMNMPYTLLVSVIVGVTNIIPFFGPFIGAIPSAFIILLVSPMKCLVFLIFILILQQFDGNILGPKILGSSTGVSGFWIMFSIILGGGLFGFMGMLLGVPVFVVIYSGIKSLINRKLKRSGLPTESSEYENLHHFDPVSGEKVENPPSMTAEERREKRATQRKETSAKNSARATRMRDLMVRHRGEKDSDKKSKKK